MKQMPRITHVWWFAATALLLMPAMALAHGHGKFDDDHLWRNWSFDPFIIGSAVFAIWLFVRGAHRRSSSRPVSLWRYILFSGGVILVVLSLQSPLDPIAEHLFWVHQIQHMMLRVSGPMAIMFSSPAGVLVSGMPRAMRDRIVAPIARARMARGLARGLFGPVQATALFILALYVWEVPALHDAALLNPALHYLMHVTMLLAGLIFFGVVFDHRDPPKAAAFGARQLMLVAAIVAEIVIGAATTMKPMVLYHAYDIEGRLYDMLPLADEASGGFLIWVPTSMMFLIAVLLVVHLWNASEVRVWKRIERGGRSNSAALLVPQTAEELWILVRPRNRRLAFGLFLVPLVMLTLTFGVVETLRIVG